MNSLVLSVLSRSRGALAHNTGRAQNATRSLLGSWRSNHHAHVTSQFPQIDVKDNKGAASVSGKQQTFLEQLEAVRQLAFAGGGPKAVHRHVEINGKVLPRDRLRMVLDEDSPFLELSLTAGHELEYGSVPCGGSITAIGRVSGVLCLLSVTEATVKGGSVYPISLKKQLRAQEIALQNRLPIVYLIDSGGAFLPLQSEIFVPGGRTFYNQAVLSAQSIPQLVVVCGHCTAGAAYIPSMADEAIIIKRIGAVFLAGPPLLKAATGEVVSAEELGGADVHCKLSGGTDHYCETEEEAYTVARQAVSAFNCSLEQQPATVTNTEPLLPADLLASLMPEDGGPVDMYKLLACILDGSRLREFKALFGPTLITGFAHISGRLVGILANNGPMSSDAALKAAHFVQICSERSIPLVFLEHTEAAVGQAEHDTDRAWLRAVSKMISTVSCAKVPKIAVLIGDSCGIASTAMCGSGLGANFTYAWPSARRIALGVESAVDEAAPGIQSQEELFSRSGAGSAAISWSARLLDDGVVSPVETRRVLVQSLEACTEYSCGSARKPHMGVLRM